MNKLSREGISLVADVILDTNVRLTGSMTEVTATTRATIEIAVTTTIRQGIVMIEIEQMYQETAKRTLRENKTQERLVKKINLKSILNQRILLSGATTILMHLKNS